MSEPRGVLLGILGGGVPPILQILTLFQTKKKFEFAYFCFSFLLIWN